jgi:hypothetical protein
MEKLPRCLEPTYWSDLMNRKARKRWKSADFAAVTHWRRKMKPDGEGKR